MIQPGIYGENKLLGAKVRIVSSPGYELFGEDGNDKTYIIKKIGEFSEELKREDILRDYGTDQCSNPFAEMVATYRGLQRFSTVFKPGDHIVFYADYEGTQKWLSGEWKAKLPYIIQIRDEILDILRRSPWSVEFKWVKGHQPKSVMSPEAYWNGEVDKLAKGQI